MKRKSHESSQFEEVIDQYGRKTWRTKTYSFPAPPNENDDIEEAPAKLEIKNLTARTEKLDFEKKIGKTVLNSTDSVRGFYCETCNLQFNDSSGYLDHINGRNHNQRLGITMKVERSTLDRVKAKLKKVKEEEKGEVANPTIEDIEKKIEKEEVDKKKKKKKKKIEEKQLEELVDFDAEEIVAFGLPSNFGSTRKK